ncbi:hypothetical protein [Microvirga sp. M2]|uniref:hypothetical protein n=1 Tax=Microvirga sp. M2 TaxID=3073270 RepID=UPI0039C3151F
MTARRWKRFSTPEARYDYPGPLLRKHWTRLHQGDREPYPDAAYLADLITRHPALEPGMSPKEAGEVLQAAWRAFHSGDLGEAVRLGLSLGPLGYNVANKATNIYATYLETTAGKKKALFLEAAERAEQLQEAAPSLCNAWYLHAQALGRYSQEISVTAALAQGLGGKIKRSLKQALKLEPRHADAHLALGVYHAEIIGKVGALLGSLTYGASEKVACRHFAKALELAPTAPIVRIEQANGLLTLFGTSKRAEARRLYEEAARCHPLDAMEYLDASLAKLELSD